MSLEFESLEGDYLTLEDSNIDFTDLWGSQTNNETVQYSSFGTSFVHQSALLNDQIVRTPQAVPVSNPWISTLPTSSVRSLILRPNTKAGAQGIANLMLRTLKSYTLMMPRHNSPPPFIHPRLISSDIENDDMEPLTNCISLVHMGGSRLPGSRKLFWKNVRLECERLREEVCTI